MNEVDLRSHLLKCVRASSQRLVNGSIMGTWPQRQELHHIVRLGIVLHRYGLVWSDDDDDDDGDDRYFVHLLGEIQVSVFPPALYG